jgi:hypothetical protein
MNENYNNIPPQKSPPDSYRGRGFRGLKTNTMDFREFKRLYLIKTLLALVAIQIVIVAVVQNFNHRPQAKPDQANVIEGCSVKLSPLTNDFDKDETDKLSVKQFSKPEHGSVIQKGNLLFYTPDKDYIGKDSLTYTISDGRKESKNAFITVLIFKNLAPSANRDMAEVYSGGNTLIDVLKNDSDRENDSIFIKGFSQPTHGQVNMFGKQFLYSSDNSSCQADSFKYVISDGKSNSDSISVAVSVKGKNHPCYPWLSCNVGDAELPGSFSCVNKNFVVEASGSDIWNNVDGLNYVYQYVDGDCEMLTKVESLEGTNEWAKAGVMVRESLAGGSKTAFMCVTARNGGVYHQRLVTDDSMEGGSSNPEIKAPYWVKLIRKGNTFSYFASADGQNWKNLGKADVAMNSKVYIGFAVTSHNNNEIGKAIFSNFRLNGKTTSLTLAK